MPPSFVSQSPPPLTWGVLLLVLGLLTSACASNPVVQPKVNQGKYRIDASDTLVVRVLPEPLLEREALVRPDGRITMDLIGDVLVQGRTNDQVAKVIQKRIARFRIDPVVSVAVLSAASQEIVVSGEVGSPSNHPAERGIRVTDAISRAGDVTTLAAASRIRIIRNEGDNSTIYLANLDAIRDGNHDTNYLLLAGDIVYVPPAKPVGIGYAIRRALYPVEALLGPIFGLIGGAIFGGF